MLILRMLQAGPAHGLQIAQDIERRSDDVLLVEQGSLYPALHRLEARGWISSSWGVSDTNRRARFYQLTRKGKKQLTTEAGRWETLTRAVARAMNPSRARS
jgi:PadR family transcriptional regulator PadR